jgi:hypothetical protein
MKDWFKPLKVYRKYLLAEKILRGAHQSRVSVETDDKRNPRLTMNYYAIPVYMFATEKELKEPFRIIEAVDILVQNKHIIKMNSANFYEIKIKCTDVGERALNDGFYKKEVINFWWKTIGIPAGVIGLIALFQMLRK